MLSRDLLESAERHFITATRIKLEQAVANYDRIAVAQGEAVARKLSSDLINCVKTLDFYFTRLVLQSNKNKIEYEKILDLIRKLQDKIDYGI